MADQVSVAELPRPDPFARSSAAISWSSSRLTSEASRALVIARSSDAAIWVRSDRAVSGARVPTRSCVDSAFGRLGPRLGERAQLGVPGLDLVEHVLSLVAQRLELGVDLLHALVGDLGGGHPLEVDAPQHAPAGVRGERAALHPDRQIGEHDHVVGPCRG